MGYRVKGSKSRRVSTEIVPVASACGKPEAFGECEGKGHNVCPFPHYLFFIFRQFFARF